MRGRPDVGVGNVRIPGPGNSYHRADALTLENAIAKLNASCGARRDRLVAERRRARGALNGVAKSILITSAQPFIINTRFFDYGKSCFSPLHT
jgi:hypothetical protein